MSEIDVKFCHCGRVAVREIKGILYCLKHDKLPKKRDTIGNYSGQSKTPYGGYEER